MGKNSGKRGKGEQREGNERGGKEEGARGSIEEEMKTEEEGAGDVSSPEKRREDRKMVEARGGER